jgi:hypothetical protein
VKNLAAKAKAARSKQRTEKKRKHAGKNVYTGPSTVLSARLPVETARQLKTILQVQGVTLGDWIMAQMRSGNGGQEIPDLKTTYDAGLRRGLQAALGFAASLFAPPPDGSRHETLAEEILENVRLTRECLDSDEIPATFIAENLLEPRWREWSQEMEEK